MTTPLQLLLVECWGWWFCRMWNKKWCNTRSVGTFFSVPQIVEPAEWVHQFLELGFEKWGLKGVQFSPKEVRKRHILHTELGQLCLFQSVTMWKDC